MLRIIFKCLTKWTHDFGYPQKGIQTCLSCGKTRASSIEFKVNPRFDVPRNDPRAEEGA